MEDLVKAVLGDPLENCENKCSELEKEINRLTEENRDYRLVISLLMDNMDKKKMFELLKELQDFRVREAVSKGRI